MTNGPIISTTPLYPTIKNIIKLSQTNNYHTNLCYLTAKVSPVGNPTPTSMPLPLEIA